MLLKYFVEFSEEVDSFGKGDFSEEELSKLTEEIANTIQNALSTAGFNIHEDKIKVDFDLEDYE